MISLLLAAFALIVLAGFIYLIILVGKISQAMLVLLRMVSDVQVQLAPGLDRTTQRQDRPSGADY